MSASGDTRIRLCLVFVLLVLVVVISQSANSLEHRQAGVSEGIMAGMVSAPTGASSEPSVGSALTGGEAPKSVLNPPNAKGVGNGSAVPYSTLPLRDITPRHDNKFGPIDEANENLGLMGLPAGHNKPDPVVQRNYGLSLIPNPILNFAGINYSIYTPPDTNGDVGPDNYIQTVNAAFQIFNKSGASLYGPANINTLWTGISDLCGTTNRGDPVVLYDPIGNRWLITQFAYSGNATPPFYQCMAVSQTPNPLGSYWLYDFVVSNTYFTDYPKIGVWPLAFFMSTNDFDPNSLQWQGPQAFAFERVAMENGQSARFQYVNPLGSNHWPFLPADMDGRNQPPDGTTDVFVEFGQPAPMYKFHVDFNNINNSYFTNHYNAPVAGFTNLCPSTRDCIPQPSTGQLLDGLGGRPLYRLAYRNHLSYESIVWNHVVDVGGQHGGVRWYEVRSPFGAPYIYQQGSYAPDANNRWMGSIAEDKDGNQAAVYSVSSGSTYPAVRYAGRLSTDPLGQLSQGEATLQGGGGSQTGANRWGDYSSMSVDPMDDCTFWFTSEYIQTTGSGWRTCIGAFRFPQCVPLVTYTPGVTNTPFRTNTPIFTSTFTFTHTNTPTVGGSTPPATNTPGGSTPTPMQCDISFSDVYPSDYFYTSVMYLACHGIISGYDDGTFRPFNNTTRGQLCKIIVLAEGWLVLCPTTPTFNDVTPSNPFYCYIETAAAHAIIAGYDDGTFRPGNNVTRGQLCKIIVLAEGWANNCPTPGHFSDVSPSDPFYCHIETAYNMGIIAGYDDSTFRPGNNATRGQICKIVYQPLSRPPTWTRVPTREPTWTREPSSLR